MIPVKSETKISGDLDGEDIRMGIDQKSLAFIQQILTDLYSDPELAVLREYSTNAWDAHVEAGQQRPIEVTTPSNLSMFFKIKDYGVGLSLDDLREIYSRYGASTKRETNGQTGMQGLGCKSALTYTGSFTIIAVKNGIKSTAIVTRGDDGIGVIKVVDSSPTDEPNGVEITVPAKRGNRFYERAVEFFGYWKPGQVLLNGEPAKPFKGEFISDRVSIIKTDRYYDSKFKVVMGGVSYNLDKDKLFDGIKVPFKFNTSIDVIFFLELGEVDFTPSREELYYTPRTRRRLKELAEELNDEIEGAIQKDVDSQATHADAVTCWGKWNELIYIMPKSITYKGQEFPSQMVFLHSYTISLSEKNSNTKNFTSNILWGHTAEDGYVLIADKPADTPFTTGHKAKLRHLLLSKYSESSGTFLVNESDKYAPWTDKMRKVSWQEMLDVKIPRIPGGSSKGKVAKDPEYWVANPYGDKYKLKLSDFDPSLKVLYSFEIFNKRDIERHCRWVKREAAQLVLPTKSQQDSFLTNIPSAVHIGKYAQETIDAFLAEITDENIEYLNRASDYRYAELLFLDDVRVEDPEITEHIKKTKIVKSLAVVPSSDFGKLRNRYNQIKDIAMAAGLWYDGSLAKVINNKFDPSAAIIKKYPLLGLVGNYQAEKNINDIILYVNAVYQERFKN